jgi:beta-N-acetylhexosaminidase
MGALSAAAAVAVAAAGLGGPRAETSIHQLTATQLAGQRVIAGYRGYKPPAEMLRRIRRGEVGGVILFRQNVKSRDQVADAIRRMQSVPRPHDVDEPLLVMVDQEGGGVVRIPGAPRRSAAQVGASGSVRTARATGRAAGRTLRAARVNVNLAPVVDVARRGSAMERERRAYGRDAGKVARMAGAFADGLARTGILASPKHFPGLGAAAYNTDNERVRIRLSRPHLRAVDEEPYRELFARGVRLVMLSTAIYTALDPRRPAALSREVATSELRGYLGFAGVSMTDALGTPATAPFGRPPRVGVLAAEAGVDLMLYSSYDTGKAATRALARAIRSGRISRLDAETSLRRLIEIRHSLR